MRSLGVRFGAVGIQGQAVGRESAASRIATLDLTLADEADTMRWLEREVRSHGAVPLIEAEAVVQSLAVAMHSDRRMILPLLQLKEFDQYTTTHSLNVSVLAMPLAESLGCSKKEVRALGMAGLMHDIGKVRIPLDILTKPGRLSNAERAIVNKHPVDGAEMILRSDDALDIAAVVAYEHHMMLDGGGYPTPHYNRETAMASRIVHVCDVFDALRTKRPYRIAWELEAVLAQRRGAARRVLEARLVGEVMQDAALERVVVDGGGRAQLAQLLAAVRRHGHHLAAVGERAPRHAFVEEPQPPFPLPGIHAQLEEERRVGLPPPLHELQRRIGVRPGLGVAH